MEKSRQVYVFHISDVMILVAAFSLGLLYARECVHNDPFLSRWGKELGLKLMILWHYVNMFIPTIFLIHVASVFISVKNRKSWDVLRNSGLAAGFIAPIIVSLKIAKVVVVYGILAWDSAHGSMAKFFVNFSGTDWYDLLWEAYHELPAEIGASVASLWLLFALTRTWRSEPIWSEVLSRVLGAFWIMLVPLSWCANLYD